MPSEEQTQLRRKGNTLGGTITVFIFAAVALRFLFSLTFGSMAPREPSVEILWRSDFRPVRVLYRKPWKKVENTNDSKEDLAVDFIDLKGTRVYAIRIGTDEAADLSSINLRFAQVKKETLASSAASRFIDEQDVKFHGQTYRRMRFRTQGESGAMCTAIYLGLIGKEVVGVVWSVPWRQSQDGTIDMPPEIKELDAGVSLFEDKR